MRNVAFPPATAPLQHLSDFVFLAHQKACGGAGSAGTPACLQKLQWIVHQGVNNPGCIVAMKAAWESDGSEPVDLKKLNPWPGESFWTDHEDEDQARAAKALIGCPNGVGSAYLLMQHEAEYGSRYIYEVRMFADDGMDPCIAWRIGTVEDEEQAEQEPE